MACFIEINDSSDERLADYVQLRDVNLRRSLEAEHGLFIAEGAKIIRRAVEAGYQPRSFLLAPRWIDGLRDILDAVDVPVYIPERDRYRLEEPDITTGISANGMSFTDMAGSEWKQPADIRLFPGDGFSQAIELAPGIALRAVPAPGHSEGSTLFFFEARLADNALLYEAEVIEDDPSAADEEHTYLMALDGDVIFKGSVGRTDLPGGDQVQMLATLRFLANAVDPATILLPGHGAVTTMEHEHHGNPYLAEAKIRGGDLKA